ncbi:MAG: hypothetical protein FJ202_12970 [Gemmatimonadetes bacterium]|nr:hypothetical protein [Gemmatimonadota bacterium]
MRRVAKAWFALSTGDDAWRALEAMYYGAARQNLAQAEQVLTLEAMRERLRKRGGIAESLPQLESLLRDFDVVMRNRAPQFSVNVAWSLYFIATIKDLLHQHHHLPPSPESAQYLAEAQAALRALNKDLGGVRGNPSFAEVAAKAATLAPVLNR